MNSRNQVLILLFIVFSFTNLYAEKIMIIEASGQYGAFNPPNYLHVNLGDEFSVYREKDNNNVLIGTATVTRILDTKVVFKFEANHKKTRISKWDFIVINEPDNIQSMIYTNAADSGNNLIIDTSPILKKWFTYWGLGLVNNKYPDKLKSKLNFNLNNQDFAQNSVSVDLLGSYWPTNEQTLLGFIFNGWSDRYTTNKNRMQINGYLYSASMMHFFNPSIGEGFFIRTDAGAARIVTKGIRYNATTSDWGIGFTGCFGLSIPIMPGFSLSVNTQYSIKNIKKETYRSFSFSFGGLF